MVELVKCEKYKFFGLTVVLNSGKVQILQNCTYNDKVQLLKYSSFLVFTVTFLWFQKRKCLIPKIWSVASHRCCCTEMVEWF